MTDATLSAGYRQAVHSGFRTRRLFAFGIPALILLYLGYAFVAFDVAGVASRARGDNAAILLGDFWSYKVHVTRDNASGKTAATIEGETRYTFPPEHVPDWVKTQGDVTRIDLGKGYGVTYDAKGARMVVPGYGTIDVTIGTDKVTLTAPEPLPKWISASDTRIGVTTPQGRFSVTRTKAETYRYFPGWSLFLFTFDSPFYGKSWGELARIALSGERLDPAMPNIARMAQDVWTNSMWHHGDVAWALLETLLMAFLGTVIAAIVSLPLSFLAARNTMPVLPVRFGIRRVFDFVRGVDALIWTIILARAFGPGPMTGALAILITDVGSFGKLFSEALENIDEKQVEGVRSTGANALQRARFGVLPQVMPVILSQVLYAFESNTRSATVIGAIVGGGIGLLLTQAIQTQKDWEDVAYYLVLIVAMVMILDWLSGIVRRRLIKG